MKRGDKVLGTWAAFLFLIGAAEPSAKTATPQRVNRAIELLEQGQPIYYAGSHAGTAGSFEQGKADAQTYADYISYDMEHPPFDVRGLADYMRGLVAGGPTRSGHRRPPVIVNVPVNGTAEAAAHRNAWMSAQVLGTAVHGIMLTHTATPGAIRAFVEAVRFPIHKQGLDKGLNEGRRGVHGAFIAAPIWGISPDEYLDRADPWPLNPNAMEDIHIRMEDLGDLDVTPMEAMEDLGDLDLTPMEAMEDLGDLDLTPMEAMGDTEDFIVGNNFGPSSSACASSVTSYL